MYGAFRQGLYRTVCGRLGICLAAHERPTALLAWNVVAILWQAGFAACQGDKACAVSIRYAEARFLARIDLSTERLDG